VGPILCAQHLLKSAIPIRTITFISSDSGSTSAFLAHEDGFAAYSASKAALNQMARHMAAELQRKGRETTILCLHPGEVETDMARGVQGQLAWEVEGIMGVEESVRGCIGTIEGKGIKDSGTFWTWKDEVSRAMHLVK
jgi:NAD(P)-dependent dehydrogenase (short-subunit alcohol dehydrogenase family)